MRRELFHSHTLKVNMEQKKQHLVPLEQPCMSWGSWHCTCPQQDVQWWIMLSQLKGWVTWACDQRLTMQSWCRCQLNVGSDIGGLTGSQYGRPYLQIAFVHIEMQTPAFEGCVIVVIAWLKWSCLYIRLWMPHCCEYIGSGEQLPCSQQIDQDCHACTSWTCDWMQRSFKSWAMCQGYRFDAFCEFLSLLASYSPSTSALKFIRMYMDVHVDIETVQNESSNGLLTKMDPSSEVVSELSLSVASASSLWHSLWAVRSRVTHWNAWICSRWALVDIINHSWRTSEVTRVCVMLVLSQYVNHIHEAA